MRLFSPFSITSRTGRIASLEENTFELKLFACGIPSPLHVHRGLLPNSFAYWTFDSELIRRARDTVHALGYNVYEVYMRD